MKTDGTPMSELILISIVKPTRFYLLDMMTDHEETVEKSDMSDVNLVKPTSKAMGSGSTSSPVQPCFSSQ